MTPKHKRYQEPSVPACIIKAESNSCAGYAACTQSSLLYLKSGYTSIMPIPANPNSNTSVTGKGYSGKGIFPDDLLSGNFSPGILNDSIPDSNFSKAEKEALLLIDRKGVIQYCNTSACALLGYSKQALTGTTLATLVIPNCKKTAFIHSIQAAMLQQQPVEFQVTTADGSIQQMAFTVTQTTGSLFSIVLKSIHGNDEKIIRSLEHCEILARATTDVIWDWDIKADKLFYNEGITRMLGYDITEITSSREWWAKNIHPDDLDRILNKVKDILLTNKSSFSLTYRFRCSDNTYKLIYDRGMTIFDEKGNPVRMAGIMQDVSNNNDNNKHVAQLIFEVQENERQQIGIELHDNVNQILSGCVMNLSLLKKGLPDEKALMVQQCREYIMEAIEELRKLSHKLVPTTGEKAQIKELFENLVSAMNYSNQLHFNTEIEEIESDLLPDNVQVNLFRVLQEQLTNIMRHAAATEVSISVKHIADAIVMRIADNGIGFNPTEVKTGIGLSNIRKRIQTLNGSLIINSAPGKGCELIVTIRCANAKQAA